MILSSARRMGRAAGMGLAISIGLPVAAQQQPPPRVTLPPAAISVDEAAALAQYWKTIAERKPAEVVLQARQLLERFPRSPAVFATAIEAEIAANGATSALTQYERWIDNRTAEEPLVLRRIARAVLFEFGRSTADGAVRSDALVLLAREGEAAAQALILANASSGQEAGLRDAVRLGEPQAIAKVGARLKSPGANKLRDIQILGDAASPLAVPALVPFLKDPATDVRGNAALAIGKSGDRTAVTALEPLLKDENGNVRSFAAAALYRLGSTAGLGVLEEHASSDQPSIRKFAAVALSVQPDERWLALVRGLLTAPDPVDRLDAARLLAPHDPEAARPILEQLAADPNLAIREETELVRAELVLTPLAELRRFLRSHTPSARVRAAGRILALTR